VLHLNVPHFLFWIAPDVCDLSLSSLGLDFSGNQLALLLERDHFTLDLKAPVDLSFFVPPWILSYNVSPFQAFFSGVPQIGVPPPKWLLYPSVQA